MVWSQPGQAPLREEVQKTEGLHDCRSQGPPRSILDLERQAQAFVQHGHGVDRFASDFGHKSLPRCGHEVRIQAPLPRHEVRVPDHRPQDAPGMLPIRPVPHAHSGKGEGQTSQGEGKGGQTTAVRTGDHILRATPGPLDDGPTHILLNRVVRGSVRLDRPPPVEGQSQHPGMLTGAVVMEHCRWLAPGNQRFGGGLVEGGMETTLEGLRGQPEPVQDPLNPLDVNGLPIVGGRHEGQVGVGETEGFRTAGGHVGKELKRFSRRAEEDRLLRMPGSCQHPLIGVNQGQGDSMSGLDRLSPKDSDLTVVQTCLPIPGMKGRRRGVKLAG